MMILGIFLMYDPKNSTTDTQLFMVDFIIIPAIIFSVTISKLIFEKIASGKQHKSITRNSRPSSKEVAILSAKFK